MPDEDISKVYVTYQKADKVGVINASTGEIIREVDVDFTPGILDRPHFVVIDDENKKVVRDTHLFGHRGEIRSSHG